MFVVVNKVLSAIEIKYDNIRFMKDYSKRASVIRSHQKQNRLNCLTESAGRTDWDKFNHNPHNCLQHLHCECITYHSGLIH